MTFKPSATYQRNLRNILDYYTFVDPKLGKRILDHLDRMKTHLTGFPEACPLTSAPPVRKFLLPKFPIRIRYVYENDTIFLISAEHTKQDKPL